MVTLALRLGAFFVYAINCIKIETAIDSACGTSEDIISAGEYLKEKYHDDIFYSKEKKAHYNKAMFFSYDMDRTMLRVYIPFQVP